MDFPAFPADWKPNLLGCTMARYSYEDDIGRAMGGCEALSPEEHGNP